MINIIIVHLSLYRYFLSWSKGGSVAKPLERWICKFDLGYLFQESTWPH